MATTNERRQVTRRDLDILLALDRCPLTVEQLLALSATFEGGAFQSIRSVHDRLQKLRRAGWVRRWRYAIASRGGAPDYYKLSLLGYRILVGVEVPPPRKRHFSEVGVAHHHHTRRLADFLVHTAVTAHRAGFTIENFFRENSLRLDVEGGVLYPDCAFELVSRNGVRLNFLVELDNGTERIRSSKDVEAIERKLHLYDRLQERSYPNRFRVLIVTTRSHARLRHILDVARSITRHAQRSLFYATHLDAYLASADGATAECFENHRGRNVSLIPRRTTPTLHDKQTIPVLR